MEDNLPEQVDNYSPDPFGEFRLACLRVGRVEFKDIVVTSRSALIGLQELLSACEKTRRVRVGKDGTRYPEPLPMASAARMLSVEITDYLWDMKRRNLQIGTITAVSRTLKMLMIACGDIPVSRIDHKHIYRLWDLLRWAPPHTTSSEDLKDLDAESLIAKGKADGVQPLSVASMELHRRFLATFFNTLVAAHAISFSPMAPFREMKKELLEDGEKQDRSFDIEELQNIFNPVTFVPWAKKFPHRWWCPMIGLHTGARIGEVAQLKVADIINEGGVWCFAIRRTVDEDLRGAKGPKAASA